MTDERLGMAAGAWLRNIDQPPRDPHASVQRAMEQVRTTRQQGRWWPLPVFEHPAPIPGTNGRQPARGFTTFSALKHVVAGVIVALFGGFLLAGVFTTQQDGEVLPAAVTESPEPQATTAPTEPAEPSDPSARTDILPGVTLTVEEVEPGVYRVANDGVRDLSSANNRAIVAGHDGSVWLSRAKRFFRLGSPAEKWQKWASAPGGLAVAPDGTVWVHDERYNAKDDDLVARLRSFEDGSWTVRLRLSGYDGDVTAWTIAPDGTVWAAYRTEDGTVVARLGADGWEPLEELGDIHGRATGIFVTESGEVWLRDRRLTRRLPSDEHHPNQIAAERGSLWRYREDEGGWQEFTVDALGFHTPGRVEVGVDGTVWFADEEPRMADGEPVLDAEGGPTQGDPFLMRFDGSEWQRWGPADGVPSPSSTEEYFVWGSLEQAPDGALWASYRISGPWRGGVDRFDVDASTWQRFLSGRDVRGPVPAADGSVWMLADEDLYVITPEAVAGAQ